MDDPQPISMIIWNTVQRLNVSGLISVISLRYSPDPTSDKAGTNP
jgi:hypothetical protein